MLGVKTKAQVGVSQNVGGTFLGIPRIRITVSLGVQAGSLYYRPESLACWIQVLGVGCCLELNEP